MKQTKKQRSTKSTKKHDRAAMILSLLREFPNNKFSLKHLASASGGATKEGRRETLAILDRLYDEGIVEECAREKYRLTRNHLPRYEGRADMTAGGSVYVRVEGLEHDIFVNQRNTANALDGDRVEVVIMHRSHDGKLEGEITRILERSRKPYVGVAEVGAHQIFVRADSRKMPMDIYLSKREYPDVSDGQKVVVRIADWLPGSKSPVGELVEVLGMAGDNDAEMHAILSEYELPYRFETEVEEAAQRIDGRITEEEIARRRDFRDRVTFTVDPADAKDFDDALSVRRLRDGVWEVGVHIADVTHYVRPHSTIDDEAVTRGTSVYLVDRTVPMLPERLSNELCSLRPDEDSLCFSAVFTLNENVEILDEWFGRTVIHSDRRFTYAEAQEIIETGRGDRAEEVLTLHRLAEELRRQRFKNGAIAFDREEVKFKLDEAGHPVGVYFKEQQDSNRMIEEFMLLANRRVAEYCSARLNDKGRKVPRTMVYRVHDAPSEEKLDRFRQFILRFGIIFKASKGRAIAREMNKLFTKIKGSTEENAVTTMAVRSMAKAFYTTDNIGHYPPLPRHDGPPPAGALSGGRQIGRQADDRGSLRAGVGTRSDRSGSRTGVDQVQDGGIHERPPRRRIRRPHFGSDGMGRLCGADGDAHRGHVVPARHRRRLFRIRRTTLRDHRPLDGPAHDPGRRGAREDQACRPAETPARLRTAAAPQNGLRA